MKSKAPYAAKPKDPPWSVEAGFITLAAVLPKKFRSKEGYIDMNFASEKNFLQGVTCKR